MKSNKRQDIIRDRLLENSMTLDKSILFVSTGAIAILVNFSLGKSITTFETVILLFSIFAFTTVSIIVLFIFKLNSDYLLVLYHGKDHSDIELLLKILDKLAIYGLMSSIISASIFFLDYIISSSFICR